MNVRLLKESPFVSVTDNWGAEVWGPMRPLFAIGGCVGGLVAGLVVTAMALGMTVGFPLVAALGSVTWQGREVYGLARLPVALVAGLSGTVAALGATALAAVMLPTTPLVSAGQAVCHGVGSLLGIGSGRGSRRYVVAPTARQASSRQAHDLTPLRGMRGMAHHGRSPMGQSHRASLVSPRSLATRSQTAHTSHGRAL